MHQVIWLDRQESWLKMKWLNKLIFGKTRIVKRKKRKLLIFIAALIMFLGAILQVSFKINSEYFLLAGFGCYTLSELFE
jgi:hypothetical protein